MSRGEEEASWVEGGVQREAEGVPQHGICREIHIVQDYRASKGQGEARWGTGSKTGVPWVPHIPEGPYTVAHSAFKLFKSPPPPLDCDGDTLVDGRARF